ncbi:MAG: PH domain-containing protein [Planctomycetes bacterium]|nr:PH domain-containing protein [Planctomycetota bacterium]
MYTALKHLVARLLRVPTEPPRVPEGAYATVEVLRASPRYLRYRLIAFYLGSVFGVLVLAVALVATLVTRQWAAFAIAALLAVVIGFFLALAWFAVRLDYDLRFYVITDRSLRVREGAWRLAEMTLTYANVQNVRIEQGPLMRLFGIQDLVVDTAGGGASGHPGKGTAAGHQVRLAGLEDAPRVRDLVLAHVKRFGRTSGLGDRDDPGEARGASTTSLGGSAEVVRALEALVASSRALRRAAETRAG